MRIFSVVMSFVFIGFSTIGIQAKEHQPHVDRAVVPCFYSGISEGAQAYLNPKDKTWKLFRSRELSCKFMMGGVESTMTFREPAYYAVELGLKKSRALKDREWDRPAPTEEGVPEQEGYVFRFTVDAPLRVCVNASNWKFVIHKIMENGTETVLEPQNVRWKSLKGKLSRYGAGSQGGHTNHAVIYTGVRYNKKIMTLRIVATDCKGEELTYEYGLRYGGLPELVTKKGPGGKGRVQEFVWDD